MSDTCLTPDALDDALDAPVRAAINNQLRATWDRETGTGLVYEKTILEVAKNKAHMFLVFRQYDCCGRNWAPWQIETYITREDNGSVYSFRRKN